MLQIAGRDINFNGYSSINGDQIVNFYGNYNKYDNMINNVNFNFNVNNIKVFLENEEAVNADFEEFKEAIIAEIKADGAVLSGTIVEPEISATEENEEVNE